LFVRSEIGGVLLARLLGVLSVRITPNPETEEPVAIRPIHSRVALGQ